MRAVNIADVRRILAEPPVEPAVPDKWTGAYVGLRLVQAFKVLASQPRPGPRLARLMINVERDLFAEELGQLQAGDAPRPIMRPSARDIRLMEDALAWPVRYLPNDQAMRHCVMIWAHGSAIGKPIGRMNLKVRARYGLTKTGFHNARLAGCMAIAIGLQHDRVVVE